MRPFNFTLRALFIIVLFAHFYCSERGFVFLFQWEVPDMIAMLCYAERVVNSVKN